MGGVQDSSKAGEGLNQWSAWKGQARSRHRQLAGLSRGGDRRCDLGERSTATGTDHEYPRLFCPAVSRCAFRGLNPTRAHGARGLEAIRNGQPPRVEGKLVKTDKVVEEQMK